METPIEFWLFILSFFETILLRCFNEEIFSWNFENRLLSKHLKKDAEGKLLEFKAVEKKGLKNGITETTKYDDYYWEDRNKIANKAPCTWKVYRFLLTLFCVFVGWLLLCYSLWPVINSHGKLNLLNIQNPWGVTLGVIIGLVGVSGRLPAVIDSIQDWFKR